MPATEEGLYTRAEVTVEPLPQPPSPLLTALWHFCVCLSYLWKLYASFTYSILSFLGSSSFWTSYSLIHSLPATVEAPNLVSCPFSFLGLIFPSFYASYCHNVILDQGEQGDIFPHLFKLWYLICFKSSNIWDSMLSPLLFSGGSSKCLFWNMTSCFPRAVSYFIWHCEPRKSQACPLPVSRWVLRNRFGVNPGLRSYRSQWLWQPTPICWLSSTN